MQNFFHPTKILFIILLAMTVSIHAAQPGLAADPEVILRLHGSNTIGAKLAPALATAFLKEKLKAGEVQVQPLGTNELRLVTELPSGSVAIEIASHGSSTSFKDLAAGKCDIGMASRAIKANEKARLSFLGEMDSLLSEHTLGLDGIAVLVHPDNPITTLSMTQLKKVFSGKIKEWSELSPGMHGPIEVFARDDKSGTYDTFKSLVLSKEAPLTPSAGRFESNAKLSETVAAARQAIGFVGLPYILRAKPLAISEPGTDPFPANNHTVATEDYPLSRRLYLYTPPFPENIYTRFFIDFSLSSRGQEIVETIGFIGQNIKTFAAAKSQAKPQRASVVDALTEATGNARRVSLNFRFQPGSTRLDDRAERDLIRLSRFLQGKDHQIITLIGFTDAHGDYDLNIQLAHQRTKIVENRLRQIGADGIYHLLSGGEELPVAGNDDEKGRQKNRRVEVWLAQLNH